MGFSPRHLAVLESTYGKYERIDGVSFFGGMELIDGTKPVPAYMNPDHVKNGTPHDAARCAYALSLQTATGHPAIVFKTTAFVQKADGPRKKLRIHRLRLQGRTLRARQEFDAKSVMPEEEQWFDPPTPAWGLSRTQVRHRSEVKARSALRKRAARASTRGRKKDPEDGNIFFR